MKALVVHNPSAGMRTDYPRLESALAVMRDAGWQVEIQETNSSGDATAFSRQAANRNDDCVFAVGGDGTVNEVLNGLLGTRTALGVLPLGTANVWAKEMGLPLGDMTTAARLQLQARKACVDVGEARGENFSPRAFLLWCGIGFDAHITGEIEPQRALKRQLGAAMFWMVGARAALTFRGKSAQIIIDGKKRRRRILLTLVSNAQLYGGLVRISPQAQLDDGLLDVAIFRGTGWLQTAWHLVRIFLGWHLRAIDIDHYRGRKLLVRAKGLPVHVDAEPIGATPVQISIRDKALTILVPPTANRSLFRNGVSIWRT